MGRDWRDDRIEELEALVERLMRRVAELEAQLAQFSGISSRPSSTDPPGAPPPSRPKRTGRRRGGSAYEWVDVQRRQLCWAHLLRRFLGFQIYDAEASAVGRSLELLAETMLHLWHRVRDGVMTLTSYLL